MVQPRIRTSPRILWLNNQQAIPPSHSVKEIFHTYSDPFTLSPSSSLKLLDETRDAVYQVTGCSPDTHTFRFVPHFPHATAIIVAALLENRASFQGRNHLVVTAHEQQYCIDALCHRQGLDATYDWMTVSSAGHLTLEYLSETLTPQTLLFSLSAANGMTGLIEPIEVIRPLCQEQGILLHLDISDLLGRAPLSSDMLDADILTFSSLSLGGMGPLGGMLIKKTLDRFFHMWLPKEAPGTLCLASIAALKEACHERMAALPSLVFSSIRLRERLTTTLRSVSPDVHFLFTESPHRLPNVMLAVFPEIPAESLAFFLSHKGIYPGIGYERFQPLSQILQNCGVSPFLCHGALHFSFTERIKEEHLEPLGPALQQGCQHLQPALARSL